MFDFVLVYFGEVVVFELFDVFYVVCYGEVRVVVDDGY